MHFLSGTHAFPPASPDPAAGGCLKPSTWRCTGLDIAPPLQLDGSEEEQEERKVRGGTLTPWSHIAKSSHKTAQVKVNPGT